MKKIMGYRNIGLVFGLIGLMVLAAIITPAANPSISRWTAGLFLFPRKKTAAAPSAVMKNVKPVPPAASNNACNKARVLSRRGTCPAPPY